MDNTDQHNEYAKNHSSIPASRSSPLQLPQTDHSIAASEHPLPAREGLAKPILRYTKMAVDHDAAEVWDLACPPSTYIASAQNN